MQRHQGDRRSRNIRDIMESGISGTAGILWRREEQEQQGHHGARRSRKSIVIMKTGGADTAGTSWSQEEQEQQ